MKIRQDIVGKIPKLFDVICYNPPKWKGIKLAIVVAFAKSGLPIIIDIDDLEAYGSDESFRLAIKKFLNIYEEWRYTPKTGFIIIENYED